MSHPAPRTPPKVTQLWTAQDMAWLAQIAASQTVVRAFDHGKGLDDRLHRRYSTERLKLYSRSTTGRAMSPKGGVPFAWVRGPRTRAGGYDRRRIGQEAGRVYAGGYAQYKRESRKGLTNGLGASGVEVNLTLSGNLARSIRMTRHSATAATIAITGNARNYGGHVNAARPFMGLSPEDRDIVRDAIIRRVNAKLGIVARGLE